MKITIKRADNGILIDHHIYRYRLNSRNHYDTPDKVSWKENQKLYVIYKMKQTTKKQQNEKTVKQANAKNKKHVKSKLVCNKNPDT